MKLAIFGATGLTGRHLVSQALSADHEVTAIVRDPARLPTTHPSLTVVEADATNPEAIGSTIAGQDAVITTIGPREGRAPTTVQTDTTTSIVTAMHHHGTRRLIAISNSGMFTQGDGPLTRLLVKPILRKLLRHPWADMRHMEDLIHATQLDWTILRPPMLSNGPHTASYRTSPNHNLRGAIRLSRANLADYILHCLTDPTTTHKAIAIST